MLYLITGTPGAGKTLRSVQLLMKWKEEGRQIFADIDGLSVEGVKPAPQDWRDTPDGSVVIYDEAQRMFGADGRSGRSSREDIQGFETHRHTGHDIVLITQHSNLLHSHVRRLVGRHEHVMRVFGTQRSVLAWRDRCWNVDSKTEAMSAVREQWSYPKELYGLYKSATIHTETRRIPPRLKFLAIAGVCFAVLFGWSLWQARGLVTGEARQVDVTASSGVPGASVPGAIRAVGVPDSSLRWRDRDWALTPAKAVVMGCISSASRCQCYSADGFPLKLETEECLRRVQEPLPVHLGVEDKRQDVGPSPGPGPAAGERQRAAPGPGPGGGV